MYSRKHNQVELDILVTESNKTVITRCDSRAVRVVKPELKTQENQLNFTETSISLQKMKLLK